MNFNEDISITINVENKSEKYFTLNCDLTSLIEAFYI